MRQVVILAGGKGTRLKSVSGDVPKPMVPILGKPLLQYLIELCYKNNFKDIKILASYNSEKIIDFFGDGSEYGVAIQYHIEETPRGTAGALLDIVHQLDENFLVMYGDTFIDVDLDLFWNYHQKKSGDVSIFLHPNDHPQDSDLVEMDENFKVTKIYGYPHDKQWKRNLVNAALYIFNKSSLDNINLLSEKPDIAKHMFPLMLECKKKLCGYLSVEYIKDMGTPERLKKVECDILSGKVESLKQSTQKSALFLDRDGVINHEVNHLSSVDQLKLIDGVGEAIRQVNQMGILVIVVTNQPVMARGELNKAGLREIHNKLDSLLGKCGAYIDRLYYCPHHPDKGYSGEVSELKVECDCRKPNIGMFVQASKELNILLKESWMVGDSTGDLLAAKRAEMHSILVRTGYSGNDKKYSVNPDFITNDLGAAVKIILERV